MTYSRTQAREVARGMLEQYLQGRGINTRGMFPCLCPDHNDSSRPYHMSLDRGHNRVKCFSDSCGVSYDIFDCVAIDYGLTDQREIFDKTYQLLGLSVEDRRSTAEEDFSDMDGQKQDKSGQPTHTDVYTHTDTHTQAEEQGQDFSAYYEACKKRLPETDYTRGLSPDTLSRFNIGYDPEWRHPKVVAEGKNPPATPRLIIPTSAYSYLARDTRQEIPEAQQDYKKSKVGHVHIFNLEALRDSSRPTFIVEGEIDAASIVEVGGSALALGSTAYRRLFLEELDKLSAKYGKPTQALIIALDNDTSGSECADKLSAELRKRGLTSYRRNPCGEYKDANEALMKNREALTAEIRRAEAIGEEAAEEERQEYMSTSAGAHLQDFLNGITESANTDAIPTGFPLLDRVLDGGLYEGLITIGGISSLGKTSLIMQVADQVAAAGYDVLIFSLEMSRSQLMSKSISRHTVQLAMERGIDTRNAKTSRGITTGKRYQNYNRTELELIQAATVAYSQYADRVYIHEGVGDITVDRIRETVERHIRITGRRPLVVCDYLQIISPHSDRATDKQVVDHAVLELKRISRDYKLPLIAISSFNRAGYKQEATFEQLKESGAIEYSSDIVFGLQLKGAGEKNFDSTKAKRKNPREIELVVLKNRDAAVGDTVSFNYYPMFNLFTEAGVS